MSGQMQKEFGFLNTKDGAPSSENLKEPVQFVVVFIVISSVVLHPLPCCVADPES
jgi:hypothetical protein